MKEQYSESSKRLWKTVKAVGSWLCGTLKTRDLWSGLFPTVLLGVAAFFALQQTNRQIAIMSEQMRYIRQPILVFEARPNHYPPDQITWNRLFLSNVGNESAENVFLRMFLLLVTDSEVFSYGQYGEHRAYFTDTTRTAKEMLWPRLILHPDSQMQVSASEITDNLLTPYHTIPSGDSIVRKDFLTIRDSLGGRYILFVESSYRRPIDRKMAADTSWFSFDLIYGPSDEPLEHQVGGPGIIQRCKSYLNYGPQLSINIEDKTYVIYCHTASAIPKTVRTILRSQI